MDSIKRIAKGALASAGLKVEWQDPLEDLIPLSYHRSQFVPKIYRQSIGRVPYFADMLDRVRNIDGDIVECGVSIGHGLLVLMLLDSLEGRKRHFWGFDSFEGFPENDEEDRLANGSFRVDKGKYSTPPEIVIRTLRDGRVADELIDNNLHLVKGFFEKTLDSYSGTIALLHLDCDLYKSYLTCFERLYDKVAPGGLILFDEYEDENFPGAKKAIDEFFADKNERIEEYNRYGYHKHFAVKV